mmetsp:Transcript_99197/g.251937  ORF Transcript_99197/g.251937 Transcript_99197/m.251937 type:complete len:227 (-) Transcript_99197:898-1578(-)
MRSWPGERRRTAVPAVASVPAEVFGHVYVQLGRAGPRKRQLHAADDLGVPVEAGDAAAREAQEASIFQAHDVLQQGRPEQMPLPREAVVDREQPGQRHRAGRPQKGRAILAVWALLHDCRALALPFPALGEEELHVVVFVDAGGEIGGEDESFFGLRHTAHRCDGCCRRTVHLLARLEQLAEVGQAEALLDQLLNLLLQGEQAAAHGIGPPEHLLPDMQEVVEVVA